MMTEGNLKERVRVREGRIIAPPFQSTDPVMNMYDHIYVKNTSLLFTDECMLHRGLWRAAAVERRELLRF